MRRARMEPELLCIGALHSPETGIIDSHAYMRALWGDLEDCGGMIAFETPVERMCVKAGQWQVQFGGRDPGVVQFDAVVNAAGLGAQNLARQSRAIRPTRCRGSCSARAIISALPGAGVFSRLIYPTPIDGGLGVHVTLDLAGRMRFGPDVEWIAHENYDVDPRRADIFLSPASAPIGRACRTVRWCRITPASGRSSQDPANGQADFLIAGPADHGLPRLVNLFGIESPGLTSSLSLAEAVVKDLA